MSSPRLIARLSAAGPLAPDVARGVRAAVATLVPFYFARQLGSRELVWLALGGWLGTLADQGGSRLSRARTLATFGVLGAVTVALCEATRPLPVAAEVVLAIAAFTGSLVRAVGAAASTMGTLVVITAAIASGAPQANPVRDATAFAIGAAWAVVLSSIVWPVWTHLQLRIALARAFRALSDYARALDEALRDDIPEHDDAWATLARVHQRKVRTAIEDARAVALATRARRTGETILGSNLRTLLGSAESHLPLLIALAEELESLPLDRRRAPAGALDAIATGHRQIADALATTALSARTPEDSDPDDAPSSEHGAPRAVVLARRLLTSTKVIVPIALAPGSAHPVKSEQGGSGEGARRMFREDLQALHDALSVRSTFLRHAVRVTLAVIAAQLAGRVLSLEHAQWVTVTTVAVLQPYPGATVTRAIERVVGTVLGSLVAVAITFTIHSPPALTLLMVPLSVAAVATRPRSHRLFTFFITPVFVLLAERWQGDWWIAAARAGAALLGGCIALVAALVFPSREEKRLSAALRATVAAVRSYAEVVVSAQLAGQASSPDVVAARREVGIALGNAETSLERLLAEPLRSPTEAQEAMLLVTHARRLAAAFTTLDAERVPPSNEPLLRAVLAYVLAVLDGRHDRSSSAALAITPDVSSATPPWVRDAFARIFRQAELVGYALAATIAPADDGRAS